MRPDPLMRKGLTKYSKPLICKVNIDKKEKSRCLRDFLLAY